MSAQPPSAVEMDWRRVWDETAVVVRGHVDRGLRRLLTEDVVRFAMITSLVGQGLDPKRITVETRDPALPGGRLDLLVDAGSERAHVVEIKFPRDPSGAADTMTLGELLSDVYRLSLVTCQRRFAVQIIDQRLLRYLDGRAMPLGWSWPRLGESFRLTPEMVGRLPKTAAVSLPSRAKEVVTTARCVEQIPLDDGLVLLVHEVEAAQDVVTGREATLAPPLI